MPRGKSPRKRRPPINRHFKIEHVLPPDVLDPYLAHLREPCATVDTAHAWLSEHGFGGRFSRSAVARHKRHYLEGLELERDTQNRARLYADLVNDPEYAGDDLLEGALLRAEQILMETVFELRNRPEPATPQELMGYVDAVSQAVTVQERLMELRRERERRRGTSN